MQSADRSCNKSPLALSVQNQIHVLQAKCQAGFSYLPDCTDLSGFGQMSCAFPGAGIAEAWLVQAALLVCTDGTESHPGVPTSDADTRFLVCCMDAVWLMNAALSICASPRHFIFQRISFHRRELTWVKPAGSQIGCCWGAIHSLSTGEQHCLFLPAGP